MKKLYLHVFAWAIFLLGGLGGLVHGQSMNIEISPDNKTPIYGEMVTFTVKMTNEYGMPATGNMDFRVLGNFVDIDNSLGMGGTGDDTYWQSNQRYFTFNSGETKSFQVQARVNQWTWENGYGLNVDFENEVANHIDSVQYDLGRRSELVVGKVVDPATGNPHNPNDDVNYLVTISNIGSEDLVGLEFFDIVPYPFGLNPELFDWVMDSLATFNGVQRNAVEWTSELLHWDLSDIVIPAGDPAATPNNPLRIIVHGKLTNAAEIGDTIYNEAYIEDIDDDNSNNTSGATAVVTNSDLYLTINQVTPDGVAMYDGDVLVWEIVIGNEGNMDATGVHIDAEINDVYGIGGPLQYAASDWLNYAASDDAHPMFLDVEGSVGGPRTIVFTGRLHTGSLPADMSVCLSAEIFGSISENLRNMLPNADESCILIGEPEAPIDYIGFDLSFSSSDPNLVTGDNVYSISGGVFDVNISIANTGTDMFDGFVECSLPQPGTWAVDGASATPVAWDWDLGNIILEMQENVQIAGGETLNISFPATMLDDEWTNFPVTCRLYEGEYNNVVVDSDTAYVLPMPDLQVIKTLQNNPSAAQDVVTFDITIENVGSADAIDFNLRDFILNRQIFDIPLDWGMTFDGQYISHVYQGPDGGFLWQGLSLGAGDTMNIVATLTLDDSDLVQIGTIFENVVTVYGLDSEYTEDNNVSQASGFVESADLYLDIQAIGDDPEHINDPVAFVINYANYGNATGDSALLEARFDHHVFGPGGQYYLRSDMEWATPQDMGTTWALVWSAMAPLAPMAPGTVGTIYVTGYLDSDNYLPGQSICLTGQFWSEYPEDFANLSTDNTSGACHYVTGEIADLTIAKTLLTDLSTVQEGDPVAYRVDYRNIGNDVALGVSLTDVMPTYLDGLEYLTSDCTSINQTISCDLGDVAAGDQGFIVVTGYLNIPTDQLTTDVTLINTGEIRSIGSREFNTGDNLTGLVSVIPRLADVWVTKTLTSDAPAVPGDTVTYLVEYGNRGGRDASGVVIEDHIFSGLDILSAQTNPPIIYYPEDHTGHRLIYDLVAGETGSIVVTAQLNDRYNGGTSFSNEVWISADIDVMNTGDDYAIATAEIAASQDVWIIVEANNLTHMENLWNGDPTWAVSGDLIERVVTYQNSGNVDLHNVVVNLQFPSNVDGFPGLTEYSFDLLPFGSEGSFVVTGYVGPQGFDPITAIGRIWAQEYGAVPADTDDATVIEKPLQCHDGYLTEDELCDFDSNGNLIGTLLPGQSCQSRAGIPAYGCEVVTEYIINTGCIDYSYTLGNGTFNGGYCVWVTSDVEGPMCRSVTVLDEVQQSTTGWDVYFSCIGQNTTATTLISMDCGNGQYITGYGASLEGVCSYEADPNDILHFDGQCTVGNDGLNPDCAMPIDINAPEQAMCESLDALDSNVLVVSDNEDGSLDFSCSATSGLAQTISIDCGNGQVFTDYDVESLSVSCDYVGNGEEQIYAVVCEVNGETADDCQQPAIVTPPFLDYCGDGIMRGYEQCDLGDGAVPIDEYLDVEGNVDAGKYGGGNYYCENCAIKTHGVTAYQPPACFNVNTNISVMEDELLPFYWTLDMNQAETDHDAGAEEGDSCDEVGAINLDTMMCTFALYNGDNYNQADRRDLDTFTLPCDTDEWDGDQLFEYFEDRNDEDSDFYYSLDYDPIGKYVIKIGKNVKVDGKTITTFDDDTFGEHKLVLERVSYDYCREVYDEESGDVSRKWDRGVYLDRVCEVNYVVTKPYLIQKSAFGATKVDDDLDLRDFYDIFGDKIVSKTDLEDVMDLEAEDLDGGVEIEALLDIFEDKYSKVAVDIPQEQRGDLVSEYQDLEKVSKVPGKNIFVFEGDGKMVMSQETGKYPATSYTIIVKGMDLYIEGSVTTNGMFIVDGNIGFQEKDATLFCQAPQEVQGIFIARDGFVGTEYSENEDGYVGRFDKNNRLCEYGNLIVKGVLIGDGINELVQSRRSHLNDWFNITSFDTALEERRDKLFDGAAVLIEYNPSLWTDLPPGAEDFTEALEVYKK